MTVTPQKEAVRGKILYYLALIYPEPATLPLLQGDLNLLGYPMPMYDLNFYLAYLQIKGLVSREEYSTAQKPGPIRKVVLVKITAKGIDYYDGRLPADPGIYVGPK
jgi:hypothetical protein